MLCIYHSRFLFALPPAVQQIPLLRGQWSATGDPPVIGCDFLFYITKFVKHLAMSGRCSRCGVSFPRSCGVWPLPLFWFSVCGRFLSWCMGVSSCWGMAVFSHFRMSAFGSFVCILIFVTRYMRPEGPWQRFRRCLVGFSRYHISISHPRPAVPSHWGCLIPSPPVRQTK